MNFLDLLNITAFAVEFLPFILFIVLFSLIDVVTIVRAKNVKDTDIKKFDKEDSNFSLLIPIFGDIKYLKNVEYLKPYGSHVVLCTTTKESKEFYEQLYAIADEYGFKIYKSDIRITSNRHKANPWKIFSTTLHEESVEDRMMLVEAREEILRDTFDVITTEYCIFMDGDTVSEENLRKLVHIMREHKYDVASLRVLVSKKDSIIEKLQSVEYQMAMDSRKIYPWLTSGAGIIAKTSVMREIMHHHSFFFNGGDIEIGKLATILGFNVGHIPFVFLTDVPSTFKAWFKQRIAWAGGAFRHSVVNMHQHSWKYPFYFFYITILVFLLFPLRWYELIRFPYIILILIVIYWVLIYLTHWKERAWYFLLFPFYAFTQVMIIFPLGIVYYLRTAYHSNNVGVIRTRHAARNIVHHEGYDHKVYLKDKMTGKIISIIVLTVLTIYTIVRIYYTLPTALITNIFFEKTSDEIESVETNVVYADDSNNPVQQPLTDTTPILTKSENTGYYHTTLSNQNLSNITRKVLTLYLNENSINLNNAQRLFVEVSIANANNNKSIKVAEVLYFDKKDLNYFVTKSLNLNGNELVKWENLSKNVIF